MSSCWNQQVGMTWSVATQTSLMMTVFYSSSEPQTNFTRRLRRYSSKAATSTASNSYRRHWIASTPWNLHRRALRPTCLKYSQLSRTVTCWVQTVTQKWTSKSRPLSASKRFLRRNPTTSSHCFLRAKPMKLGKKLHNLRSRTTRKHTSSVLQNLRILKRIKIYYKRLRPNSTKSKDCQPVTK